MVENEYRYNRGFREYVDNYCADHKITVDQALKQEPIRQAFLQHTDV